MPLPLDKATANLNNTDVLQDVFNKTFGFQKIFVINLPSRTDHRDSISSAAAFSDLQIEYVDGVTEVEEKTLPPGEPHLREVVLVASDLEEVGTHRSEWLLNITRIVEENITSALILEDDSDWDIRIKSQMRYFARA
ncbi:hypothetical protein MPH_10802 [Macrophomina phaseolina MS6]|uniref:Glycosyl transferase family 25 n=1 Tax=Macrophomina phaseolina (strain MS6) TaxID=1126212 RepID=K2QQC4_MACPH|nr:hypothetical protein MPH_10802 [Macrophomina phaseolina MS6]